jgi:hypothetical protein
MPPIIYINFLWHIIEWLDLGIFSFDTSFKIFVIGKNLYILETFYFVYMFVPPIIKIFPSSVAMVR